MKDRLYETRDCFKEFQLRLFAQMIEYFTYVLAYPIVPLIVDTQNFFDQKHHIPASGFSGGGTQVVYEYSCRSKKRPSQCEIWDQNVADVADEAEA